MFTPISISCMPNLDTSSSTLCRFSKMSIKFTVDHIKASTYVIRKNPNWFKLKYLSAADGCVRDVLHLFDTSFVCIDRGFFLTLPSFDENNIHCNYKMNDVVSWIKLGAGWNNRFYYKQTKSPHIKALGIL